MKTLHLSRFQAFAVAAAGSFLVAVMVAQFQYPALLQAKLLATIGQGPQCWRSAENGDVIFDDHDLEAPWSPSDASQCSGMQMGDLKRTDGSVMHWGQWDAARIGGRSYGSSGGSGSGGWTGGSGSGGNSVNKVWDFTDGKANSAILNRTDEEYMSFIRGIEAQCRSISKDRFSWMPQSGNSGSWREFGIPDCSGNASGGGSSGGGSSGSGSGTDMYVCYENSGTNERKVLLGRDAPAGGQGWWNVEFSKCNGIAPGETKKISDLSSSGSGSGSSGSDGSSGGGGGGGGGNYVCYRNNDSGEIMVDDHARGSRWTSVEFRECDGLKPGEIRMPDEKMHGASEGGGGQYTGDDDRARRDAERSLSDMNRALKDRQRELERNFRDSKVDLGPAKELISKWEAQLAAMQEPISRGDFQAFWDKNRDLGDLMQEVNDAFQKLYGGQRYSNFERHLKDRERELSDMERNMKDLLRRQTKGGSADTSVLQQKIDQFREKINEARGRYQAISMDDPDMEDKMSDLEYEFRFEDVNRDFYDAMNEMGQKEDRVRQQGDAERIIKEKQRFLKDKERAIKEHQRMKHDTGKLEGLLNQMREMLVKMEALLKTTDFDPQDFWDLNQASDDLDRDFWDANNELGEQERMDRESEDAGRWAKDFEREVKDRGRFVEQLRKEAKRGDIDQVLVEKVAAIFEQMKQKVQDALSALNTKDYEKARDILQGDLNDLRQEFEDAVQGLNEGREHQFAKRELERTSRDIEHAQQQLDAMVKSGRVDAERAKVCQAFIDQGRALVKEALDLAGKKDTTGFDEIRYKMESLGSQADRECADVIGRDKPDYEGFNEVYVDEPHRELSREILERVSEDVAGRVLDNLGRNSTVFNEIVERVGERFKDRIAQTLEATSFIAEDVQQELLSRKAAILEQVKEAEARLDELSARIQAKKSELQAVLDQVAGYNFVGSAGSEVEEEIDQLTSGGQVTPAQVQALKTKVAQAIQKAREEKFERGIIPFKDTDDNDWFTKYAVFVKEKQWVKGTGDSGYTQVNPGAETNVAEAITMIGRVVGEDSTGRPESAVGNRLPEWARGSAAALEHAGVDLDALFVRKRPGDSVTRAEIARLVREAFNLPAGDASQFPDAGAATAEQREDAGALSQAGIMTGEGDGRFNFRGVLNRAALMKILTKAAEVSPNEDGRNGITPPAFRTE